MHNTMVAASSVSDARGNQLDVSSDRAGDDRSSFEGLESGSGQSAEKAFTLDDCKFAVKCVTCCYGRQRMSVMPMVR